MNGTAPGRNGGYAQLDRIMKDVDPQSVIADVDGAAGTAERTISSGRKDIGELCKADGITAEQLFASAFGYTLSRFTGSREQAFTAVVPAREGDGYGFVPVMIDCSSRGVSSFLRESSASFSESVSLGGYPLKDLVERYGDCMRTAIRPSSCDVTDLASDGRGPDIVFSVREGEGGFTAALEHTEILSVETAERFLTAFDMIISGLLSRTDVAEICYTPDDDIALQEKVNSTGFELKNNDIIEAFGNRVRMTPERTALSYLDNSYTYAEVDSISDSIASRLASEGIGRGDSVAMMVPRSEWYLLCAIGIMKTGACYVPVDTSYPDERARFMLSDSSAKAVLATPETSGRASSVSDVPVIDCTDLPKASFDAVRIDPKDTQMILYTSGSTGTPKGTLITHLAVENFSEWVIDGFELTPDDVTGLYSSIGFDVHIISLYPPVHCGCSVDIIPEDCRLDMAALDRHFASKGISCVFMTTAVCRSYLTAFPESGVRVIFTGGEAFGKVDFTHRRFHLGYGPTEYTASTCARTVGYGDNGHSVGYMHYNTKAYILDAEHRRVPYGAVGELYLSGYQISSGYLNNPEKNASSFFDNPFSSEKGYERMYATGDFFRLLPDGTLGVIGRRDGQIKIRGNRVELTEVEACIRTMPGIDKVTVQPIVAESGTKELCAYVVSEGDITADELQRFVAERKPEYMVPTFVIRLDSIPLNVNGKVDRRALPKPDLSSLRQEYVAPRNEAERMICDAFAETFSLEKVGIDDDFIRLGGDSLKAIRMQNMIPADIDTADILRYKTPREIQLHIPDASEAVSVSLEDGCPLIIPQLNVYNDLLSGAVPDSYTMRVRIDVPEGCTVDDAETAVRKVVDAHPILSCRISLAGDTPVLVPGQSPRIIPASDVPDAVSFLPDAESLCLFAVSPESVDIYISHLISDGRTLEVLRGNTADQLGGKEIAYEDEFLRTAGKFATYSANSKEECRRFFDGMFRDTDAPLLVPLEGNEGRELTVTLGPSEKDVQEFCRKHSVTAGSLLTQAFGYALSRFTGGDSVVFTTADMGRTSSVQMDAVGMFVNTVPLCIDCTARDIGAFVREQHDRITGAMQNNLFTMGEHLEHYGVRQDIMFQYFAGLFRYDGNNEEYGTEIRGISFYAFTDGGAVRTYQRFQPGYAHIANRLTRTFDAVLSGILSGGDLADIDYLSAADREDLEALSAVSPMEAKDLIALYRERIEDSGGRRMVVSGRDSATYAESDLITGGLAQALSDAGVGKGDRVAVVVDKNIWTMLCPLAVMRAGAAYVPVDQFRPRDWIDFVIRDSKAVAVMTDGTVPVPEGIPRIDVGSVAGCAFSDVPCGPGDAACIVYTSGTTGEPKGAVLTRGGFANLAAWQADYTRLTQDDVFGMYPNFGFCSHIDPMYCVLIPGACQDIVPEDSRKELGPLKDYVRSHGITAFKMPAAMGRHFLPMTEDTSLRFSFVSGEKLGPFEPLPWMEVADGYGPTENTAESTCARIGEKFCTESVGRPLPNVGVYILDAEHRRVPPGAMGELWVSGAQIQNGYLGRDDLTAGQFIPNPFPAPEGHGTIYNTGDLFRFLPDGQLGVIGRKDRQIKVRGNRVEITEVEACIRSAPGVDDVAVIAVGGEGGSRELCAYVSPSGGTSEADIRRFVQERKPDYMVPSLIIFLDSIPHNVNGKVDKRALPAPDLSSKQQDYAEPRDGNESMLCEAFRTVLGIDRVGIDDDFLLLGGDSLKAIKVSQMCQNKGFRITTADILVNRTVRLTAPHLSESSPSVRFDAGTGCPLTGGALDVYLDIASGNQHQEYVIPVDYPVPDGLSEQDVAEAVDILLEAHPVLKCSVRLKDGEPWFVPGPAPGLVTVRSSAEFREEPLDPSAGVCRFTYISDEHVLRCRFHHTAFDAPSIIILGGSLGDIFSGKAPEKDLAYLADAHMHLEAGSGLEFFSEMFADVDGDTSPPADYDGSADVGFITLSIPKDGIADLQREHGTTPANLLAQAFGYAVSRYSGLPHAVISNIVNGREGAVSAIGMFARTVPVLIDCADRSVKEFLGSSNDVIVRSLSHQLCPFWKIQKEFGINLGTVFNFLGGEEIGDEALTDGSLKGGIAVGDLIVSIVSHGNSYIAQYHNSSKYSPSKVRGLMGCFDRVVSGLQVSENLQDIGYLDGEELGRIDAMNATARGLAFDDVVTAFGHHLKTSPDRTAVRFGEKAISFAEAERISDSVAQKLASEGIGPGSSVGILVPRSEWYFLCILGVLKTGAAYVPLDTEHPDERLHFMVSDSGQVCTLVTPATAERISGCGVTAIDCTSVPEAPFEPVAVPPQQPAVVLYSSGTTGQPKGSVLTRRAAANLMEWYSSDCRLGSDDVVALHTAFVFDMHMVALLAPMYSGCCVDVIPPEVRLNTEMLREHVVSHGVTNIFLTTQLGKMFQTAADGTPLRTLVLAGEKLGEFDPGRFGFDIIDAYGPSENHVSTSVRLSDRHYPDSVGLPLPNVRAYILDREHRRVPAGAVGELYLAGHQLSLGYLNRPERNAEQFFPNPFSSEEGYDRMYATGDLFRILPDGTLGILGRRDHQVKIRGNRVEPTEVEACIRGMPGMSDVTVQAISDDSGSKELCAYIVGDAAAEAVQEYVAERKPDYMVPAFVIRLDSIPLNVNGKVDKRALPRPDMSSLRTEYEAPGNGTERIICDAFAEALGIDRVGVNDDFIRLGGDSLKAIRLAFLCRQSGISLKVPDIISRRTPRMLAPVVSSAREWEGYTGECPITPIQQWFYEHPTDRFNQSVIVRSDIRLDQLILQKALDVVTDRHDMLRCIYKDGKQIVRGKGRVCTVTKGVFSSKEDMEDHVNVLQGTLSMSKGRLIACCILSDGECDRIFMAIHHMVVDAVSWAVILNDLAQSYLQISNGGTPVLPPRTMPFAEWAKGLGDYVMPQIQKRYWKSVKSEKIPTGELKRFLVEMPVSLKGAKDNIFGATNNEILFTAVAESIAELRDLDHVSFKMEGHGRDPVLGEVSGTVGWFTCIYPLSIPVTGEHDIDLHNAIRALRSVPEGGQGYALEYGIGDLPNTTFNYLSDAFSGRYGFLESDYSVGVGSTSDRFAEGLAFYIDDLGDSLLLSGYIDTDPEEFGAVLGRNIEQVIASLSREPVRMPLTETQLNVYLDEMSKDLGTEYNVPGILPVGEGVGTDRIREAIARTVDAHPVLRARVDDSAGDPYLVTDAVPPVEVSDTGEGFVRPFDLRECLCRFRIVEKGARSFILFDAHHSIMDATGRQNLIGRLRDALDGKALTEDFGFAYLPAATPGASRHFEVMLAGRDMDSDLPRDGTTGTQEQEELPLTLDQKAVDGLCGRFGTTVGQLFTAVFGYTLSRFTGRSDAVFVFTDSGRDVGSLGDQVGMFVRTMPVAFDSGDAPVVEFVRNASQAVLQTMENGNFPFRILANEFGANIRTTFEFNSDLNEDAFSNMSESARSGIALERGRVVGDNEQLFIVYTRGDGYLLTADFCSSYDRALVKRFLRTYDMVLANLGNCADLGDIPLLSDEDAELVDRINRTEKELTYGDVIEAFRERATSSPDSVYVASEREFTYREIDELSDGIASELAAKGIGKGDRVSVMVPRSEWYHICSIGVLKTGAAYVPLDPSHPDERLSFIMEDSGSRMVIVAPGTAERARRITGLPLLDCTVPGPAGFAPADISPGDTAVVLYTSGTTGNPKGTAIPHLAVESFLESFAGITGLTADDRLLFYHSYGFDVHMESMLSPIIAGCVSDVIPDGSRLDMDLLKAFITDRGITVVDLPTSVAKLFIRRYPDLPVRTMFVGGEKLGELDVATSYPVIDVYGPTEYTVNTTYIDVGSKADQSSVGVPYNNTAVYILDAEHRRVPYGAVGELFVSGYQLSSGYLNNPEKNAAAFHDNPYSDVPGYERMYATGDFFRFLPDGTLGIIGRRDGQVKIRGNRVELTEIEECIRAMPSVSDVTVQPVAADSGTKELCAYIVSSGEVSFSDVRTFVSSKKPDYMVPSFVIRLDQIPLNVNGKVDRRSLPVPDVSGMRQAYAAPRNESERIICEQFRAALGIDDVGIDDDFIRLGGDSLKAIRAVSLCRSAGLEVSVPDILHTRVPREIARLAGGHQEVECIYTAESGCPVTGGQLNIYLDMESGKSASVYIIDAEYDLPEGMSEQAAVATVRRLLDAHPVLRQRISVEDGVPWFRFDSVPDITVSDAPVTDIRRPFDLSESLSRFNIVRGKRIQAAFHHTVSDGLSVAIIGETLERIFGGEDVEADLGFLRDASLFGTADIPAQEDFYRSALTDVPSEPLQADADGTYGIGTLKLSQTLGEINEASKRLGTTSANLLAQAFGYTLSRFTGSEHAVFSHIVNGRDLTGSYGSVGMFVRTLPVAVDCRDRPVREFVRQTSDAIFGTISNQLCPFQKLSGELNIGFGTVFNHLSGMEQHGDAVRFDMDESDMVGDLSFSLVQLPDSYMVFYAHSAKYSDGTVSRMAETFDMVVSGLISCEQLSDIPITSERDIAMMEEANGRTVPLRYTDTVRLFRAQCSALGPKPLLTYLDRTYSYDDVDRISDSIANALSENGVSAGDSVGIMVPRSEWYLLCALGVLKTGAAYVPVDVTYPDERAGYMLSDSCAKAVLVTPATMERASGLAECPAIDCTSVQESYFAPVAIPPGSTAAVMYTSGTTGKPKGTRITHLALENLQEWGVEGFGLSADDVNGLHQSIGFDAHFPAFYPTIQCGGRVDIIPEDCRLDMDRLSDHLEEKGVSFIFLSTQLGKSLIALRPDVKLRTLHVGGEALGTVAVPEGMTIIDGYGPTENTACSMSVDVSRRTYPNSVGIPNYNVRAYILDREHRRVPYGAVGELFLSGYQISSGYLNNPEKNASSFFDNPFSAEKGYEKMYATGDFFRMLPDGTFGVLGRRDGQVKIRGNRVELTEVESCIKSHPGVIDVTVQPIVRENGSKELCAYVVSSTRIAPMDVQMFVGERKPEYMVPSFVVFMDSIPLNINGKVDRKALPEPDVSMLKTEYVAPSNPTEAAICQQFEHALDVDRIGIHDDFVLLGGDSLKAIKAVSFCRSKGIEVKAKDIISSRTASNLSAIATSAEDMGSSYGITELGPSQRQFLASGTPEERRLFAQCLDVRCLVPISRDALQTAIDTVTDRHDMLRAVFGRNNLIRPPGQRICSVRTLDSDVDDELLEATRKAFDDLSLEEGRLMECILLHRRGETFMRLIVHHLVADAASWSIILDDITICLQQGNRRPVLPPRTLQYRDWASKPKDFSDEREFWDSIWVGQFKNWDPEHFRFKLRHSVNDLNNRYGFEQQDILLTAFARGFKRKMGTDTTLRMEGHGRDQSVQRTVGMFTSIYPMNFTTTDDPLFDMFETRKCRRSVPREGAGYLNLHPDTALPGFTFNYLGTLFEYKCDVFESAKLPNLETSKDPLCTDSFVNIYVSDGEFILSGMCDRGFDLQTVIDEEITAILRALAIGPYRQPIQGPALNVYLDDEINDRGTAYACDLLMPIPDGHTEESVRKIIDDVMEIHPVLRARVQMVNHIPYFICDADPLVDSGTMDGFLRPFNQEVSLSRFRIDIPNKTLRISVHHTIFDATAANTLLKTFSMAFEGKHTDTDTAFIEAQLWEPDADEIRDSREFLDAHMPADISRIEFPSGGEIGGMRMFLSTDRKRIESVPGTTPGQIFTAAFGFVVQKYSGRETVVFPMIEKGRDVRGVGNGVGSIVRTFPVVLDLRDRPISEYLEDSQHAIIDFMSYNRLPFYEVSERYGLDASVMFEYLQDLNDQMAESEERSDNTGQSIINPFGDLFCPVTQHGDRYRIALLHSNKVPDQMCKEIAETYDAFIRAVGTDLLLSEIRPDIRLPEEQHPSSRGPSDILRRYRETLAAYPDRDQVRIFSNKVTYREFDALSDAIAAEIVKSGACPGDRVAVLTERGGWFPVCAIGALKAGCQYVPLSASNSVTYNSRCLDESRAKAVIVTSKTRPLQADTEIPVILCDSITSSDPVCNDCPDTVMVLFGLSANSVFEQITISSEVLENLCQQYISKSGMTENSAFAMHPAFDVPAHALMFAPLCTGGVLDVIPTDALDTPVLIADFIKSRGITHIFLPQSVYTMCDFTDTGIRSIFCGGKMMTDARLIQDVQVCEMHGPAEFLSAAVCSDLDERKYIQSAGFPLGDLEIDFLDIYGHRQIPNAAGRVQIRLGSETYTMGQLGLFLPDGSLRLTSRPPNMNFVSDYLIDQKDLEKVILEVQNVEAVSVSLDDSINVVYEGGADPRSIADHVSDMRPKYMVPNNIRKADQDHVVAQEESFDDPDPYSVENRICKIMSDVLKTKICPDDDIFNFGCNSIKTMRMSKNIKEELGVTIPPMLIATRRTARNITTYIDRITLIAERGYGRYIGLTDVQMNILYQCITRPEKDFSANIRMELPDNIPISNLRNLLDSLTMQMPIITQRLDYTQKEPRMELGRGPDVALHRCNPDIIANTFVTPFYIWMDQLTRITLCEYQNKLTLFIMFHSMIVDMLSFERLSSVISDILTGKDVPIETSVLEQLNADRAKRDTVKYHVSHKMFSDILGGAHLSPILPQSDSPRKQYYSTDIGYSTDDVDRAAQEMGIRPDELMCAQYYVALREVSGIDRPIVHLESDGRENLKDPKSFGQFGRPIPVAPSVSENGPSAIASAQRQIHETVAHSEYPLWELQKEFGFISEFRFSYSLYFHRFISQYGDLATAMFADNPFYDAYAYIAGSSNGLYMKSIVQPGYDGSFVEKVHNRTVEIVRGILSADTGDADPR